MNNLVISCFGALAILGKKKKIRKCADVSWVIVEPELYHQRKEIEFKLHRWNCIQ